MRFIYLSFALVLLFACESNSSQADVEIKTEEKTNTPAPTSTLEKPSDQPTQTASHDTEHDLLEENKTLTTDKEVVTVNEKTENKVINKITKQDDATFPQRKSEVKNEISTSTIKEKKQKEKKKSNANINHEMWEELTQKYVSSKGKVNYNGFKSELSKLKNYIYSLGKNPVKDTWTKNEELAYWYNIYNAGTVYLIAKNYPLNSIKDIANGKPWDKKFIPYGAEKISLNKIEHEIVREKFDEPLVHVSFNCAAISCPILLNEAFVPEKLDQQMRSQAKKWVNDPTKNKINSNPIKISQLFKWYKGDFEKSGGAIQFINKYSNTKVKKSTSIEYMEYNWDLNE